MSATYQQVRLTQAVMHVLGRHGCPEVWDDDDSQIAIEWMANCRPPLHLQPPGDTLWKITAKDLQDNPGDSWVTIWANWFEAFCSIQEELLQRNEFNEPDDSWVGWDIAQFEIRGPGFWLFEDECSFALEPVTAHLVTGAYPKVADLQ